MPTTGPNGHKDIWLQWARHIQAIAQTGLAFCQGPYDKQRYTQLQQIAAQIVALHTDLDAQQVFEGFSTQPGYATVKVDVRGAVIRDRSILLVQERRDQRWCMPGGWADVGERPSDAVAREIWEESGLRVRPVKLIGVFDANRDNQPLEFYHAYKIVFLCQIIDGQPRPSDETMAVGFFDFADLPPLSADRTNARHIAEIQAHLLDPARPAFFD